MNYNWKECLFIYLFIREYWNHVVFELPCMHLN